MDFDQQLRSLRLQVNFKRLFLGFCERSFLQSFIDGYTQDKDEIFEKIIHEALFQDDYIQEYSAILILEAVGKDLESLNSFHPNTNYRKALFLVLGQCKKEEKFFHFLFAVYRAFVHKIRAFDCARERQLLLEINLFVRLTIFLQQDLSLLNISSSSMGKCLDLLQEVNPFRTFIDWHELRLHFEQLACKFWMNGECAVALTKLHHSFLVDNKHFDQIIANASPAHFDFFLDICVKTGYAKKFVECILQLEINQSSCNMAKLFNLLTCLSQTDAQELFKNHFLPIKTTSEQQRKRQKQTPEATFFEEFFLFHAIFDPTIAEDAQNVPLEYKYHWILLQKSPEYKARWRERDLNAVQSGLTTGNILLAAFLHLKDGKVEDSFTFNMLFDDGILCAEHFYVLSTFILPAMMHKLSLLQIQKSVSIIMQHLLVNPQALQGNFHIWNSKAFQQAFVKCLFELPQKERDAIIIAVPPELFPNFSVFPQHLLCNLQRLVFSEGFSNQELLLKAMELHCNNITILQFLAKKLQFTQEFIQKHLSEAAAAEIPHEMLSAILLRASKQPEAFSLIPSQVMQHFINNSTDPEDLLLCPASPQVARKAFDFYRAGNDTRFYLSIISAFPTEKTLLDLIRLSLPPSFFLHLAHCASKSQFSQILCTFKMVLFHFPLFYNQEAKVQNASLCLLKYATSLMEAPYKGKQLRMLLQQTIPCICPTVATFEHIQIVGEMLGAFIHATFSTAKEQNDYLEPCLLSSIFSFFHQHVAELPFESTIAILSQTAKQATSMSSLFCSLLSKFLIHWTNQTQIEHKHNAQLDNKRAQVMNLLQDLNKEKRIFSKYLPKVIVQLLEEAQTIVDKDVLRLLAACCTDNEHSYILALLNATGNENRETYAQSIGQ